MDFGGFTAIFRLLRWVMVATLLFAMVKMFGNAGRGGDPAALYGWTTVASAAFGGIIVAIMGELVSEIATDIRAMRIERSRQLAHDAAKGRPADSPDQPLWR